MTFDYFRKYFDVWCTEIKNNSDWKMSRCACPAFLKNYKWKHNLGVGIRLRLSTANDNNKVLIGQKRKRGRPGKAKSAVA